MIPALLTVEENECINKIDRKGRITQIVHSFRRGHSLGLYNTLSGHSQTCKVI